MPYKDLLTIGRRDSPQFKGEKMKDEEPMSNCCNAHFTYPGWPDSDLCSKCFEHADIQEEEDSDDYYKDIQQDR